MRGPVPNTFPTRDPGSLRLAIVGEAPGADECALGYPFAGKSGWWLNQWLAQAGVNRASVFLGNVSQMRPSASSNEFDLLEWNGAEVQSGIAQLRLDLERFAPHCILCLGNAALHLMRHGNVAPPKSRKLGLFQWPSKVGFHRGSLFEAARSFDGVEAALVRERTARRSQLLMASTANPLSKSKSASDNALGLNCGVMGAATFNALNAGPSPTPATPYQAPPRASGRTLVPDFAPEEPRGVGGAAGITSPALPSPLAVDCGDSIIKCALAESPCSGSAAPSYENRHQAQVVSPPTWKAIATYHPASTFREPSFTYPLVNDLKRAVSESSSPALELPTRRISLRLSADEVERRCAAIRAARQPVGFDIEGGLRGLQCLSFATSPSEAFVVDCLERDFEWAQKWSAVVGVLEDPAVPKVLWNAMYERAVLECVASVTLRNYEDGMLAWWERFSELPKGLDFVASILTREPCGWHEGIGWDARTGLPKIGGDEFLVYNGVDSCVTLEIWQHPLLRAASQSPTPCRFTA